MGDPLSVPGTAVGIVSLGLSVCQGIYSYYSAFQDGPKETQNILQRIDGLQNSLGVLGSVFQKHENLRTEPLDVKSAKRQVLACQNGLVQLKDILDKFKATPVDLKRSFINRASYPFKRDTIKAILEHVQAVQLNLDTSLAVLQLQV